MLRPASRRVVVPVPAARTLVPVSLLALLAVLPTTVGAPTLGGIVSGPGTATTFQVFAGPGGALEGGAYEWTLVCGDCFIRITLVESDLVLVQNGAVQTLPPGKYEIRDYSGLFMHTQEALGQFAVELHGHGRVLLVEPF